MSRPFAVWLERVLAHGESAQASAPEPAAEDRIEALPLLRAAHERRALSVAGPTLTFLPESAWQAVHLLAEACWKLVAESHATPVAAIGVIRATAADHLSVDLALRYLPAVYRRATTREHTAALAAELEPVLRKWPLSGVLADLDGEPTTAPDFDGHFGLQLLYAERLVKTARPGWIPKSDSAREWAERVFHERGRTLPAPPNSEGDDRA